MSRITLVICGVILLAAVSVPMSSIYDEKHDDSIRDAAERTSIMLDHFWDSEADTMTLRGWEILPSSECSLEIDGHNLTVNIKDRSFRTLLSNSMEGITLGYSEEITIEK